MTRRSRLWIYGGLGALLLAVVVGVVIVRSLDETERARLAERSGVVRTGQKIARRFNILVSERLPRVFALASRRKAPPNPFRVPRTPDDPNAEPVTGSGSPPVGAKRRVGEQGEAPSPLAIFRTTLVTRGASHIAEPHVATDGERVLEVWNWGAAASSDSGQTFEYLDPSAFEAGKPEPLPFCCDQLAYYSAPHDLWIWLLQYRGAGNTRVGNTIRIAYAVGPEAFDRHEFAAFDLKAGDLANARSASGRAVDSGAYLDFSRIAATNDNLFLTVNMFSETPGAYQGSVVIRMPLSAIVARTPRSEWYLTDAPTAGLTSGAADTMYFAAHRTVATLMVCRWEDDSENPSCGNVGHSAYPDPATAPYTCQRRGAPVLSDWCQRLTDGRPNQDDRPLSGWVADGLVGFSWNARQDPANGFPYPFTMVVRIDESTMTVRDEPVIWQSDRAYLYAAVYPNARGDLGGVALSGGGEQYQTCVTLVRDADAPSDAGWIVQAVDASDSDSSLGATGDYLGVVPSRPDSNTWVGSCMTLHGGGEQAHVEVRFVGFGRQQDAG